MIHYVEFDTTTQNLLADLRIEILKCTDWARIGASDAVLATATVATSANQAGGITVLNTAGLGVVVGSVLHIDNGSLRETRVVTSMTSTQFNFTSQLLNAHAVGTEIRLGNEIYKATTTRGAQMVIDLAAGGLDMVASASLSLATYRSHDGTVGLGKQLKYLTWRYNSYGSSTALHVTLSLSKEHFFIMIEGPRPGETGATSTQYGSFRNYFFLSDVVPYDETDTTPVVVSGGANMLSVNSTVANSAHVAHVSRNLDNTASWLPVRLASLQVPSGGESSVLNVQRQRQVDGRYILTPYVVFADDEGMRGRLYGIFFAGFTQGSEFSVSPPSLGARVQYQGLWYKLIAVNKGDGNRGAWGPLGLVANESTTNYQRSIVVGIQCLP